MRRSTPSLPPILLLIAALLVACGGSNPTATTAPSAAPSAAASIAPSAAPASAAASASAAPTSATPAPAPSVAGAASPARPASPSVAATPSRPAGTPGTPAAPPRVTGNLTIFAAASLTDAFNEMKAAIEAANPGTMITFNFGASSALRTQLEQGARADLYASADTVQMENASKAGLLQGNSRLFVRNTPVIIVPANNPANITTPADLAKPGVKLILAAPEVPIGNYARQVIKKLGTDPANGADYETKTIANLVSNEANVRQVVSKIQLGEGDAGIVYASDVTPAVRDQVRIIAIPAAQNVIAEYPVAIVKGTTNATGAQQFVNYLLSPAGQAILQKWGFVPVSSSAAKIPPVTGTTYSCAADQPTAIPRFPVRGGGLCGPQALSREFIPGSLAT
jgi:molybdate transport system substrate-binding protein